MEVNLRSYTTRFLKETDIFPDDFIKECKDNENEAQFLHLCNKDFMIFYQT